MEITKKQQVQIKSTISLLSSMIRSGEQHTDQSEKEVLESLKILVDPVKSSTNKNSDIEKVMFPHSGELICDKEAGTITATIVDMELDPYNCIFDNDNCVQIDTKDYTHIILSVEKLNELMSMTSEANSIYAENEIEL